MAYPKTYKTDKGVYEIPEKEVSSFLKDFPNAMEVVSYKMGKDTFDIPVQETEVFLKENPQAVPLKKKEPSGNGLQEPSDGGLGGTTPKTETFPTIEMYQTPTGDLTEDPFAQVKKSKELLGKTKVVSKGGIGGMGMGTTGTEIVPDEEATKEAKKIQEELKRTGYKEDFFAGISDLPEDAYNNPATSKETLSVLYKNNPVKFTQLTNEAKNKYAIRDAAAKKAYDEAQGDDKQKTEYASRVGILKGNEYSGDEIAPPENMQQFYDIVRQKQQLIDQNIDSPEEKKKAQERLRQTYAQAINPTSLDFREEYENSGLADKLDVTQYAGLKTYELFEPEKAKVLRSMVEANITPQWNVNVQVTPEEQVRSIVTDSAMAEKMGGTLSQLTVNKRIGKEEALRELSLLGATNEYDSIVSEQNDLKNKYKEAQTDEEKANIYAKMLLNEQRANDLQKTEAKNDERYPITAKLKMDNLVKEIVQDRGIGVGGWMWNKYTHGVGAIVDVPNMIFTNWFGSEKEKTDLRMKLIGEGKQFEASIYLPESERGINSPVIIQASDELKKKAKEILNGRSLSELSADERNQLSQLVADNQDQIKTITNPEAGKSKNFWSKATGMTIAGFTSDMGAFLTKMGLMQGVGMGAKAAEATTLFMDGYEPAFNKKLSEGASVEAANEYGILHGAVLSLMSKFGSKYETIKNVVKGGNSPISKYIAGLSEESWNKLAGEAKPFLSRVGKASKDIIKEQGKMIGTFGVAAPVASALADNLFYDEGRSVKEIADEVPLIAKEMAIGGIGFGLFGLARGVMKTKATPVEKAALFEMADFPELGKMRIDEAVKNREISKEEGERKKGIIDNVSRLVEQVPEVNDKGKPLNDQQRANYLFNLAVKESQKEKAKTLPEKQAEEAKQKALVADKENQIELEALTEKQLNDRKDKLEKAISKVDEKGKPELSDKEMADAKAELQAVENIIKSKGDTSKTEEKLPKLSEPIEGTDEYGVSIGEDVPAETNPLTKEAEDLLASIGEGSKPTFITKNLERIAKENGIEVTDKMSADDVINALKEKQKQPSEQVGSVVDVKDGFKQAGEKARGTKDATHIGRWMLDNSQKGDVVRFGDGGYEVTEVNTRKDGTKEIVLTPFEFNEDGTKDYNNTGIKIITEQSIKNGSNLFENAYTNSKGERVVEQSTYERGEQTKKADIERRRQEELNNVGVKQKERAFSQLRDEKDEDGKVTKVRTPEEKLNAVNLIERNVAEGSILTKEEQEELQKTKDELASQGYEVPKILGQKYHEGMKVLVTNSIPDKTLAEGEEVITKVLNPQINKDGKMVQTAQIEVTVGTKKGGLTREQWLEEQKKKETRTDKINAKYDAELAELENPTPSKAAEQPTVDNTLTQEAKDLLKSIGEGSKPTFITKNLERIAKENGIEVTGKMSADDVINALKEKQSQPTVTNKEQIPNEPITEPVTKPIPEVTETAKEQGTEKAVPEGTIETGRTEPEGTAAVLDADVKKAILDAAIDKKSEKGKQMAMEEEAAKYGEQGAKILSEIRGGEPPKPPTGEFKTVEDIGGQDLSGIRKALVSDKIIEGVDLERVSDKEMMSMGRKILDTGEIKPEALVEKIITDGKGVLTPTEVVGLITYKRDIDNALQDTYTKIAEKKAKGEDIGTLGVEAKNLERQIHDFDVMAVITAQQQSMAFRLRQRMLDREYNVVTQIEKYKANNNGEIEADVEAKFRELDKQLKDVKDKLIDAEKRLSEKEGQDAVNNIKESVEREKTYTEEELDKKINEGVEKEIAKLYEELPSDKKSAADKAIKALEKFREKIKRRTYESTLGIPMAIADLGAATAIRAIKVGKTVAEAVEIGINRIKKALKEKGIDTWEKESEYRKDLTTTLEEEGVSTKKKPKDKPVINEDGTVSIPNEMLRDLVKRGITDINDLTKAVHDQVKKDLPDISERQVRDYITDYGKKVNPTADEIQIQVNTAKRVGRLLSELEDIRTMGKLEFLAKYQKPKPSESKISEREQELRRQIKALGKDIVGDVSKGTKESESRHQKRIENLEKELLRIRERRHKEPQEKKESTREIEADEQALLDEIEKEQSLWDAEKDAARQFANDYGKMETERNRQLKRVGELNEKIKTLREGKLPEGKVREPKVDTPEIEALKNEKDALEKSVRESISQEKKMKDLDAELQRLKDRKEKEPKPDSKRVISAEERLKRDEIEAERKAWAVEKNIEKLNIELQRVRDRQKKVSSPNERRELTITEKDLVKQINAEKEVWRKEVEPEKKVRQALKDAQKSLDEYERRIAEKDFSKKTESATPETHELKALREKRDAKRKEYEKLKKDSVPKIPKTEAERLKSAKESVKRRITDLETKIKNKDFAKPAKKLQPTDNELVELNAEKERLQEEFDKEQYALELKNRNVWQKWEDRAYEATSGLMRGLTLGVDLSAAGVQGMRRLFTNPKESAIAFWDGLKFLVSEKGANAYMDKQKAQPYYPLLRATKLAIDDKSGKQSVKEGMFVSEWINFIWNKAIAPVAGLGTKWGTDFVRKINPYAASQRAYDGYVNSIRIQTYLKLAKELSRDGYTYETDPKVFDKMADFVNTTTGRGSLGAADANSRWLNVFLTAPRKVISEVKLYTPYAFVYYARMPKAVRMKALKDFAQFTGTFLAVNALMWAARKNWDNDEDDDNFWNMNSSDFLTHKFGDKRVSIGGGMKSILTMQARFLTGKYTDQYGVTTKLGDRYGKPINTRLDLVTRFAIGKAAPVFNVLAKKLDERAGRPVENEELIKNISVPLWIQDVGDLYKNDPNSVAPLLMTLSILGANVRTVDKSKSQLQSEELLKEPIFKEYIDKGVNFPELNPEKIQTKEVNGKVIEKLSDYDTKIQEDFIKKKKEYLKQEFLKLKNGTIKVYVDNDGNATTTPSRNKKLKPFNQLTKEQIQNVISTSISGKVTEKVKKEVLKDKKPIK